MPSCWTTRIGPATSSSSKPLEAYEQVLLKKLKAGLRAARGRSLARFEALTTEDVRDDLLAPYSSRLLLQRGGAKAIPGVVVEARGGPSTSRPVEARRADCPQRARPSQRTGHRRHACPVPGRLPAAEGRGQARLPERRHGQLRPGRHRDRSLPAVPHPRLADDSGQVDREPRKPTDRAGDGQPDLAAPFWPRHRRDSEQFRQERRAPHASRAAGLAGPCLHRARLEHQGDAPPDPALEYLSPVFRESSLQRKTPSIRKTTCSGDSTASGWRPR